MFALCFAGERKLQFVAGVLIPLLVAFAMAVVGLELTIADFRRVLHYPGRVAAIVLAQALLLPLTAWVVSGVIQADAYWTAGLMLVASAPIAASANYYAMLARADVPLAVTLTAVSTVFGLVATPLVVASAFDWLVGQEARAELPVLPAVRQLLVGLALPMGVGMTLRQLAPEWSGRNRSRLQRWSLLALLPVLVFVLTQQLGAIGSGLGRFVAGVVLFTAFNAAIGYAIAAALWGEWGARTTVTIGFCDRNLSAAIVLAATVLGRLEFVAFCAAFFVIQAVLLAPVLIWARKQHRTDHGR